MGKSIMKNLLSIVILTTASVSFGSRAFSSEEDAAARLPSIQEVLKAVRFNEHAEEGAERLQIDNFGDWIVSERVFNDYFGREFRWAYITQELPDDFGLAAEVSIKCGKTTENRVYWLHVIKVPLRPQAGSEEGPVVMFQIDDGRGERRLGRFGNFTVVEEMIKKAVNSEGETLLVQYKDAHKNYQTLEISISGLRLGLKELERRCEAMAPKDKIR